VFHLAPNLGLPVWRQNLDDRYGHPSSIGVLVVLKLVGQNGDFQYARSNIAKEGTPA